MPTPEEYLIKIRMEGNVLSQIELLRDQQAQAGVIDANLSALSNLTPNSGEIAEGDTWYGEGDPDDPTSNPVGTRMVYPPVEIFTGIFATLYGMNITPQFWLNALDGSAGFAGGAGTIDGQGINLAGLRYALRHYAESADGLIKRFGRFEMATNPLARDPGMPVLSLTYHDANAGATPLVTYDFEDGTLQGWTYSGDGTCTASTSSPHSGSYCLRANHPYYPGGNEVSPRSLITAEAMYEFSLYYQTGNVIGRVSINWYDAASGGTLLRSDNYTNLKQATWTLFSKILQAPTGALSVEIHTYHTTIDTALMGAYFLLDDVSVVLSGMAESLFFDPMPVISNGKTAEGLVSGKRTLDAPPAAPVATLVAGGLGTVGAHRAQFTYRDNLGETTGGGDGGFQILFDATNKQATIKVPGAPAWVTKRRLYMTEAGNTTDFKLAYEITGNAPATQSINIADASLGAAIPTINTTGERAMLPDSAFLMFNQAVSVPGALVITIAASQFIGAHWSAPSYALNDDYVFTFPLVPGSYTVSLMGVGTNTSGISRMHMNEIALSGFFDWYRSTATYNLTHTSTFTITQPGIQVLRIRMVNKNASSSNYRMAGTCITINKSS